MLFSINESLIENSIKPRTYRTKILCKNKEVKKVSKFMEELKYAGNNYNIDPILRDILLSHVMVREMSSLNGTSPSPQDGSRMRTRIRIHLIPYSPGISLRNNVSFTLRNAMGEPRLSVKKRNSHVDHLPRYQRFNQITLKKFSDDICSICHGEFTLGEYYRTLPICSHSFHKKCVDRWLRKDIEEMRCPLCRESHTPERWMDHQRNNQSQEIQVE